MSREQGPHLWGCDRPRKRQFRRRLTWALPRLRPEGPAGANAPAADAGVLWHAMTVKEAAS